MTLRVRIGDVLSGRAGLRGVRWILLSETTRQGIKERLQALLRAGAIVRPWHLREVRFKLGRKLTAYYDAVVSGEGYRVRPIAVTWGTRVTPSGTKRWEALPSSRLRRYAAAWRPCNHS